MPPVRPLTLRSRFLPSRADRPDAVLTRAGLQIERRSARPKVLVARSLLRVRCLRLPEQISLADRWGALRAQALAWQPFEHGLLRMGLRQHQGLLVAWDSLLVERVAEQLGVAPDAIQWLPEIVVQAPLPGLQLLQGMDGFEARCTDEDRLQHSRWWPELPDAAQWSEFLRTLPAAWAGSAMPAPLAAESLASAWLDLRPIHEDTAQQRRQERWWVAGVGLALALAAVPTMKAHVELRSQRAELNAQLERQMQASEPLRQQQQRAMAMSEQAQRLAAELDGPQPLSVLAHLAETLPRDGVLLREFDLEGQRLRLVLEVAPTVSRGALVSRMQQGGWFAEVVEQGAVPRAGWVAYGVTLSGHRPVPSAAADAASSPASRAST